MSAIITERIKKLMIQNLFDDISDSAQNKYYIALGKADDWNAEDTPTTPVPTDQEIRSFRNAAQAAKQVTDWSFVVPYWIRKNAPKKAEINGNGSKKGK